MRIRYQHCCYVRLRCWSSGLRPKPRPERRSLRLLHRVPGITPTDDAVAKVFDLGESPFHCKLTCQRAATVFPPCRSTTPCGAASLPLGCRAT